MGESHAASQPNRAKVPPMSHRNAQGLAMSVGSAEAAQAFDALTEAFLKYRLDAPLKLKAALTLDPAAPMPHVMKGSFALLAYKAAALPAAQAAAQHAHPAAQLCTSARLRQPAPCKLIDLCRRVVLLLVLLLLPISLLEGEWNFLRVR